MFGTSVLSIVVLHSTPPIVLKSVLGRRRRAQSRHCYVGMGLLQDALADIQEITNLEGGPHTSS